MQQLLNEADAIVKVSAALVAQALPFTAANDVRYYLNGICIRPHVDGGVQLLASDGHTAIALYSETCRAEKEVILRVPANVRAHLNKGGSLLHNADGFSWVTDDDGRVLWVSPEPAIDFNKFPDVISVAGVPSDYDPGLHGSFNPALLEKARKSQPKRKYPEVSFWTRRVKDGHGVAMAVLPENSGFVLIMPMRDHKEKQPLEARLPKALQNVAEEAVAA